MDRTAGSKRELARERERRAWELRVHAGLTHEAIARRPARDGLGPITRQGVSLLLARVERRGLATLTADVARHKRRQVAALDALYCEAIRAWHRSKRHAKLLREKTNRQPVAAGAVPGAATIDRTETIQELREQVGDPRFLTEARGSLAQIAKLLGLDAEAQARIKALSLDDGANHASARVPAAAASAALAALADALGPAPAGVDDDSGPE